jgi:hypothetical protein
MPRHDSNAATNLTATESRAPRSEKRVEHFRANGNVYRWEEGGRPRRSETAIAPREQLASLFTRSLVPQAERRGARGLVFEAATPAGIPHGDVRWISWRAPGDPAAIWGLYLAKRWIASDVEAAANDAFVLVAWGDGAALAWADERHAARAALRAALHAPPPWAERGIHSRDTSFAVTVELVRRTESGANPAQTCLALVPPVVQREVAAHSASREVLLGMVRAWRASHPLPERA